MAEENQKPTRARKRASKPETPPAPEAKPDPFDPAALRLDPNASTSVGVKKLITNIAVRKPNKQAFVRAHPEPDFWIDTAVIEDERNREIYMVAPSLRDQLPDLITSVRLVAAVDRHKTPFLWTAKVPSDDGRSNHWHTSMMEAQEQARDKWVRVQANMSAGSYEVLLATGALPDPTWPDLSFNDWLRKAFADRMIDSEDHPLIRELLGLE